MLTQGDTIKTLQGQDENQVFEAWKKATEEEKEKIIPILIRLLQKHAYAVCWVKLKERRPDIVNDAVWHAIDKSGTFKGESQFSTWYQTIVQNLCNSALRKKQRQNEVELEQVEEGLATPKFDAKVELEQLMKPLKHRQKVLISMKLKGMSDAEIGEALGIKELAVRHAFSRIKEKMRDVNQS